MRAEFLTVPARLVGELDDRIAKAAKSLLYYQTFLDECLSGILPNDVVLIGAPTGIGKTDLALSIAASNASARKRVYYFALEAEPRELERRTKFALLSRKAYENRHRSASDMNYTDWLLGKCEHVCGDYNRGIDQHMLEQLGSLWTFYRDEVFNARTLREHVMRIHTIADLIVIDHLHYIDMEGDDDDDLGATVKTIRDVALLTSKPIILIAHLRKRDVRGKQLVATIDDFHGSSNVAKICTQAILLERANGIEPTKWFLAPTFMQVVKDRRGRATGHVALTSFDRRSKSYTPEYTLGRLTKGGTEWESISLDGPDWAKSHRLQPATVKA